MKTWQFRLSNLQGVGPMLAIYFFLFTLDCMSEHSHSHAGLVLHIAWNLPCYLHFAFCLFVWLIKLKCVSHPSHNYECFRGSCLILRGWKGESWSPELMRWPKLKEALGDLILLFIPCFTNSYSKTANYPWKHMQQSLFLSK